MCGCTSQRGCTSGHPGSGVPGQASPASRCTHPDLRHRHPKLLWDAGEHHVSHDGVKDGGICDDHHARVTQSLRAPDGVTACVTGDVLVPIQHLAQVSRPPEPLVEEVVEGSGVAARKRLCARLCRLKDLFLVAHARQRATRPRQPRSQLGSCERCAWEQPSAVDFFWPADDVATAVRSRFEQTNWQARVVAYRPVEFTTEGSDLVVRFRYQGHPELFAVRFSLDHMPQGPQTGEVCESLDEWAQEVDWVLDEELNTRMVETAERTVADDGEVTLRWRNPSGTR